MTMRKDHKGYSLVELICTIAIFSIIITGVGTAMVVSARNYQNGSVELDLQQQAQITSNLLTNLIIDSDRVVEADGSRLVLEKVEAGVLVTYEIQLESDGSGGYKITYTSNEGSGILAENVEASGFSVARDEGGNVDFTLKFREGDREYESVYHVTPRNGVTSGGAATTGAASLFVENEIVLEPGETYDLNVRVLGTPTQGFTVQGLEGHTDTSGTKAEAVNGNTAHITVGLGETSEVFHFQIKPQDSAIAPQNVNVRVRRVNAIHTSGYKTGGTVNKAGASYKVTAPLAGTNLERIPGAWYDVNYVDPYAVDWSFVFTKDSATLNAMDYIEITGQGMEGNIPYVMFRLKQNMTEGCRLRVIGTALHPEGVEPVNISNKTNKSGEKYGTVSGFWDLEYQAWKRNGKLDIAIHHLGDADMTTSWADGKPHYTREAKVSYWAYDKYGNYLEQASAPWGYNPWTSNTNNVLNAELDGANVRDIWSLILNVETSSGPDTYSKIPYSTPYYMTNITDRWYTDLSPANGYSYRYNYGAFSRKDVASYRVRVDYQYTNAAGEVVWDSIEDEHAVEDVSILYRNSLASDWIRDNIIYVTTLDSRENYKVYFKFDRGWEGDDYYFSLLERFVGVVADKPGNIHDIRRDIRVSGASSPSGVSGGNPCVTFSLTAEEKAECKALTQGEGDRITVKYEYNPYFGKMNFLFTGQHGFDDLTDINNYVELPAESYPHGLTQAQMDAVKGCAGSVVFCFKEPNITGAVFETMYCPTLTEYGPVYYIDDNTRFTIQAATAQYQKLVGGMWSSVTNLTWNGSGWTAN